MIQNISHLPTDIDDEFFVKKCFDGSWLTIYTDWIVKLQEAGKPVEEWITSRIRDAEYLKIKYLRDDTQDVIQRIHWSDWDKAAENESSMHLLNNVREVYINRFAITELPPWLFNIPNLSKIAIEENQMEKKKLLRRIFVIIFPHYKFQHP